LLLLLHSKTQRNKRKQTSTGPSAAVTLRLKRRTTDGQIITKYYTFTVCGGGKKHSDMLPISTV